MKLFVVNKKNGCSYFLFNIPINVKPKSVKDDTYIINLIMVISLKTNDMHKNVF